MAKISDAKRKRKKGKEAAAKALAAIITPIPMIRVKGFQACEDRYRMYASTHGELPTDVIQFIDNVSLETFGIIEDDTRFRFPDEYYGLRENDPRHGAITKQSWEHDAWYKTSSLDIDQTVQYLLGMKLDFRHPDGHPLLVTKLFARQAEAATRGRMGKIPDPIVVNIESWENKLEKDLEKWQRSKRSASSNRGP